MNILILGVSNVGKRTIGKIIAEKLGYDFYDLDVEVRHRYKMTTQEFIDTY